MDVPLPPGVDRRVLLLAPTQRDADITSALLGKAGLSCVVCPDLGALCREAVVGVGTILTTGAAVADRDIRTLLDVLDAQPAWSDLPVVLLLRGGGQSSSAIRIIKALRNVTLLDRPTSTRSVVSAVQAAVRGRMRQYEVRDQIAAVERAESRTRRLQEELSLAIDGSDLGTFHAEIPLGPMILNERSRSFFWLAPEGEFDFEQFYARVHLEDHDTVRQAIEQCVFGSTRFDVRYRVVSPSGDVRWLRSTGRTFHDAHGQPLRFDGTTHDVTERERTERELRDSQERFETLANAMPQLAWMAEADGSIFWYNRRWHEYCGTTAEAMAGWGWESVHDPAELPRVLEGWRASIQSGEPFNMEFPLRGADGVYRWFLTRVNPVRDDRGHIHRWFGTNTDVSESRRQAEARERLLQAERAARAEVEQTARLKDEFLATLSHELRTPLNAILGWSLILRSADTSSGAMGDELAEGLAVIERNARAQNQIIEDLLDMSRIISGKVHLTIARIELAAVVAAALETVGPAAAAKGIRMLPTFDSTAEPIYGDPHRLQQVFWNLLFNAVKFTGRGGTIRVVLARVASTLELSVSDSGDGISPEFLPYVFDRFRQADASTTRRHGGLGLGLAIVKQLVELHGGTVRVESAGRNQGTTFTVSLPLSVPATAQGDKDNGNFHQSNEWASRTAELPLNFGGLNVLVVDDERDARLLIQRLLEARGAAVRTAESVAEAWQLLEQSRPDILISDIGMPAEDGYVLIRRLRAAEAGGAPAVPAIALTAYARSEDRMKAVLAGFQMHVPKPVDPAELLTMIASLTGGSTNS